MNCTFEQYPSNTWQSGWMLEPRDCSTSFRKDGSGYFFRAEPTVGRICPNFDDPEWSIQIPVPQNCHTSMLFNGFCGYITYNKKLHAAEVLIPEPGVLWGHLENIPAPAFVTDLEIQTLPDGSQWLESDLVPGLLVVQDHVFCLVTKTRKPDDARLLAEKYLEQTLDDTMADELERRAGATSLFEQMVRHDALAASCAETMVRAVRPPESGLTFHWSESANANSPQFNIDDLYPLALAWRHIDINIAEELILSTLGLQSSNGAIPAIYSLHETYSLLEAPKPLIAKAAEKVWLIRREPDFLRKIVPPLRRYMQWILQHFDPKRRKWYFWQNRKECIVPELYESEAATVDLTVLLLTEIDALNRLREMDPGSAGLEPLFKEEHENLETNLQTQFWNDEHLDYGNAYLRGKLVRTTGFLSFIPMLHPELPASRRDHILERIRESGKLPGDISILSWRDTAHGGSAFSLLQQSIALEALKVSDSIGTMLRDYARIMLEGFVNWSSAQENVQHLEPLTASHIINLQETHNYRYVPKSKLTEFLYKLKLKTKADRTDLFIILVSLLAIFCAHTIYSIVQSPEDLSILEARLGASYENRRGEETVKAGMQIISHYPDQAEVAKLYTGNVLLMKGEYALAAKIFASLREDEPDCPAAMISLGLALQHEGRFAEADKHYEEFALLFDEIFPSLTEQIEVWRTLLREGFHSPPNWQKIYRYKIMHEL